MPVTEDHTTTTSRLGTAGVLTALLSIIMLLATTTVAGAQTASSVTEDQRLAPAGAQTGDQFGTAVAQDGDTLIVGAPGAGTGTAHVFTRNGDSWTEVQTLTGSDAALDDQFGAVVVVSGDTAIVGAPNHDNFAGAVYIFTRTDGTWTEQQKLIASDAPFIDSFGAALAIHEDTLVVGAPFSDAAYIFSRTGTTWTESQRLDNGSGLAFEISDFGISVAVQDDTVLVGSATGADEFGIQAGTVHVFERQTSQWVEVQTLTASDGDDFSVFGISLALDGDTLVVGAIFADNGRSEDGEEGAAYVFTRTNGTWTEQQKLIASDGTFFEIFGWATALDGDTLVVGAVLEGPTDEAQDASPLATGAAYVFTRTNGTWTERQKLVASDGQTEDLFGGSLALDGLTLVVGTGIVDGFNEGTNAAYVFNLPSTLSEQRSAQFCNGEVVTVDLSLGDRPTDGPDVILGTPGADVINAGDGNDTICAGDGNDIINAGNGADTVIAGNGDDTIQAGQGRDFISAGAGDDFVSGGKGKDTINGDAGNDDLRGNEGTDTIDGGLGDDELRGGQKADEIFGGDGDDNLIGGTRPDVLVGGFGFDTFNGGGGFDTCFTDFTGVVEPQTSCESQ